MTILIKNGQIINPATATDEVQDLLIVDGKVAEIGKLQKKKADRVIDAKGCYVMPGFIDMHVHLRDPGFEEKETIETGCRAAAHGGFTTILAMPNTKPVVDNADVVNYVHNKAKNLGIVHVYQVGAVTKGQEGKELSDIDGMADAGILAISEDGKSVMNAQLYRNAMEKAAERGLVVLAHCQKIKHEGNHQLSGRRHHCKRYHALPGYRSETSPLPLFHKRVCLHGKTCQDGTHQSDG